MESCHFLSWRQKRLFRRQKSKNYLILGAHTNAHTHTHTRSCTHVPHAHNRPENCPEDFYTVMSKCHKYSPKERITFEKIVEAFSKHNIDSIFEGSVQV